MLCSEVGNIKIASGIQATPGIGRKISSGVNTISAISRDCAIPIPIGIANTAAITNPTSTRRMLLRMWEAAFGDCTKAIAASATAVGAGTLEKLTMNRNFDSEAICQSARKAARARILTPSRRAAAKLLHDARAG